MLLFIRGIQNEHILRDMVFTVQKGEEKMLSEE